MHANATLFLPIIRTMIIHKNPMNFPLYLKITWQCDVTHCQRYNEFGSCGLLFILHPLIRSQHSKNMLTCICRHCLLLTHYISIKYCIYNYYDIVSHELLLVLRLVKIAACVAYTMKPVQHIQTFNAKVC